MRQPRVGGQLSCLHHCDENLYLQCTQHPTWEDTPHSSSSISCKEHQVPSARLRLPCPCQILDVTEEFDGQLMQRPLPEWPSLAEQVKGAFKYLENRLTGMSAPLHLHLSVYCKEQRRRTGLLRAFNQTFAYGKVDDLWVHQLAEIPSFHLLPSITQGLLNELPAYLAACRGTKIDHSEVPTFTQQVLSWWASNHTKIQSSRLGRWRRGLHSA